MEGGLGEQVGIIPRAFQHVFEIIHSADNHSYIVQCSMLELYNEQIYDLLEGGSDRLELRERPEEGFYV